MRRGSDASPSPPHTRVEPLTPGRLDDFLAFFDQRAFANNPRWQFCYCQFLYVDHAVIDWNRRTADENRAAACTGVAAGRMQGFLAYRDEAVVGWCNAAPRPLLAGLDPDPELIPHIPGAPAAQVGAITCFVVDPAHRRTGIARALLRAACEGLRARGMTVAEARPVTHARTAAQQHSGPLDLYLSEGFVEHRRDETTIVVRKTLAIQPRREVTRPRRFGCTSRTG